MRSSSAFSCCRRDRLVGVFDGPVVVGPERGLEGHAAALARARQVDGVVFHHRAGGAVDARELGVGQLLLGVDARGAEVVAQAERMADLVHHRVLDVVVHEVLGLRAVGIELAARLEHVQRIAQLLGRHVAVDAVRMAGMLGMAAAAPRRTRPHRTASARAGCAANASSASRSRCRHRGSRRCAGRRASGAMAPKLGTADISQRTDE